MEIMPIDNEIAVKQANKLIESIYRMDVNEHKLLLLAIKKVNEMELKKEHFDERTRLTISASEFAKQYDIATSSAFEILVEAKKSIYEREFVYLHRDKDGTVSPMRSRWFQARGEDKIKSEVAFMFSSQVIPLIYLVKSEYTLLDLEEIGQLKSKYAVRLYKYLMRWVNAPYKNKIPTEQLREIFGLEPNEYPEMRDFRKRVLDIAVKQVKAGTGFKDLTVTSHKSGVKISAFSFHYTAYTNEMIKNSRKQIIENEKTREKDPGYVIYQMSQEQIESFSKAMAVKTKDNPAFAALGQLVDAGQDWTVLAKYIASDFKNGIFAPYLEYLKLLGFKPTKLNKTPLTGQSGENTGDSGDNPGDSGEDDKKNPFKLPESMYEKYLTKGGTLTRDQILEAAMAENMPPAKIMLAQGINIFAS